MGCSALGTQEGCVDEEAAVKCVNVADETLATRVQLFGAFAYFKSFYWVNARMYVLMPAAREGRWCLPCWPMYPDTRCVVFLSFPPTDDDRFEWLCLPGLQYTAGVLREFLNEPSIAVGFCIRSTAETPASTANLCPKFLSVQYTDHATT